jgi:hypothetical protein
MDVVHVASGVSRRVVHHAAPAGGHFPEGSAYRCLVLGG